MFFPSDEEETMFTLQGYPPARKHFTLEEQLSIAKEMQVYQRGVPSQIPDEDSEHVPEEYKQKFRESNYRLLLHQNTLLAKKLNSIMSLDPVPKKSTLALLGAMSSYLDLLSGFDQFGFEEKKQIASVITGMASALAINIFKAKSILAEPYEAAKFPEELHEALASYWAKRGDGSAVALELSGFPKFTETCLQVLAGEDKEFSAMLGDTATLLEMSLFNTPESDA